MIAIAHVQTAVHAEARDAVDALLGTVSRPEWDGWTIPPEVSITVTSDAHRQYVAHTSLIRDVDIPADRQPPAPLPQDFGVATPDWADHREVPPPS